MTGLAALRDAVEVLEPGMPGYESARPALARFAHVRPLAVVRCLSTEDIVRTLDFARRSGVHVVPRGGGHCFAGRSSTDGIVLDLTPLRSVTVSGGSATIGAGARLAEVYDALHGHGLTLPAGCGPTVGIAGLTLGGGLGILGRRYGLTCDRLRAARVVLADGRVVDCDSRREPDLFWALRGAGGGQFGVVTSLRFEPVPEPLVTRFVLRWPFARAAEVIAAWQEWAPDAPDEVSASLQVTAGGAVVFGAGAAFESIVERVGTVPDTEVRHDLPYRELKRSLAGIGPPEQGDAVSKSEFFARPLPAPAIAALLDTFAGGGRELNFTPMGGAYNRVPAGATAFVHRTERFVLEHVGPRSWARGSWACVHPWGSGRVYPNFPDPDLTDPATYHGANHARLVEVKRRYDPDRLFRFPHSL